MTWNFNAELAAWGPHALAARATPLTLAAARAYCAYVTRTHYENFTVVSWLLPRHLVPHFQAVYSYCRWADDLADETDAERALPLLDWWRQQLLGIYDETHAPHHPIMMALRETVRRFAIPPTPFLNLLVAFEQDQRVKQYETFADVLAYCQNSANPVGRLVLYLFECFDEERGTLSDEVCTGLQLANFWQDVARDAAMGRCYLPREDCERFGYRDEPHATAAFRELLRFQVERTRGYFARGRALLPLLPRSAKVDVSLFIGGGEAILDAIERQDFDVWTRRPTVTKLRKLQLFLRALLT